jgi:hypothetical protein
MIKFSEIESFRHVLKNVERYVESTCSPIPVYDYVGTVKLHGSNAGIRRTIDGELIAQSRTRILDIASDNYGFAKFINDNRDAIHALFNMYFDTNSDVVLYGEWIGKGIQSSVAISELDKHFVLFSVRINGEYQDGFIPFPEYIQDNEIGIYNISQIPSYHLTIDFSNPTEALEDANRFTLEVEEECPWGKFRGVTGTGEGIVWIPIQCPTISDLWFKTKGGKHSGKDRVKGIKASISPEKAETIAQCLHLVLPEWRLQQGLQVLEERGIDIDYHAIGPYLKWINQDILKEESDTISENNIEWKEITKAISSHARKYIMEIIETY